MPAMHLSRTDFPIPLLPMMVVTVPRSTCRSMPSRTRWLPKDFFSPRISKKGVPISVLNGGDEVIECEHGNAGVNDRASGGLTDATRACFARTAVGVVPFKSANRGHD